MVGMWGSLRVKSPWVVGRASPWGATTARAPCPPAGWWARGNPGSGAVKNRKRWEAAAHTAQVKNPKHITLSPRREDDYGIEKLPHIRVSATNTEPKQLPSGDARDGEAGEGRRPRCQGEPKPTMRVQPGHN